MKNLLQKGFPQWQNFPIHVLFARKPLSPQQDWRNTLKIIRMKRLQGIRFVENVEAPSRWSQWGSDCAENVPHQNLAYFYKICKLFQTWLDMKATNNENCTFSKRINPRILIWTCNTKIHISKSDFENKKFPVFESLPSFHFKRFIIRRRRKKILQILCPQTWNSITGIAICSANTSIKFFLIT